MRGAGQIAELARDRRARRRRDHQRRPGPPRAARLAGGDRGEPRLELVAGLRAGGTAIVPARRAAARPHVPGDVAIVTFGAGRRPRRRCEHRAVRLARTCACNAARRAGRRAGDRRRAARADRRRAVSALRGQRTELAGGVVVVDDCYNANPMSMRAALDELAACAGPQVAVLGDMLELGPDERRFHEEIGAYARERGATCWSPSARAPPRWAATTRPRTRPRRPRCVAGLRRAGRHRPRQGLARRGPRGRRRGAGLSAMGEILIGGTAALLICIFLSPEVHRVPARPRVRPAHPRGGARRATTRRRARRRWAGSSSSRRSASPFLILSDYDWRSIGVFAVAIACALLGLRRRLHEDHQAPLARAAGADQARR